MNAAVINALVELAYPLLVAVSVAVSRALGMVMLTPAFTRLGLTGLLRSAVAIAISLPVVPAVFQSIQLAGTPTSLSLTGLVIKEMVVGGVIGLAFGIPFWAAEVAGDLVDLQRGSTMAQLVDPLSAGESSITATLLSLSLITLFFMSGGFLILLDGYYRSYELWPATRFVPVIEAHSVMALLGVLDRIMLIGVVLIAPVVIALLIADFMLAYLSRMAPQFHVFDLSMAVKNLLFSFLMVVYAVFLVPLMLERIGDLTGTFGMLQGLAEPGEGAP